MLTSVAVLKEHVLTTTGMWVPVQDEETAAIFKGLQIMKPINARDMWTWIETQFAKNSAEKRRNEIQNGNNQLSFPCNNHKMLRAY